MPLHMNENNQLSLKYEDWALKFAVSVSWRVLIHYKQLGLSHFSEKQLVAADYALNAWREFLLDNRPHPAQFQQHMLPLGPIEHHTSPEISPYINRYILRSIDMEPICSEDRAFIYTKLGKIILFGFIQEPNPKLWKGTKLHVNRGIFGNNTEYVVPNTCVFG